MTPSNDASLGLREVQERFNASAEALEEVRARADELAALAARRELATQSIEEASDRLREVAVAADATVTSLSTAQEVIVEAFAAVQSVMDGTELRSLRESIDEIEGHFNATTEATVEAIDGVQQRLAKQAAEESARLREMMEGLASKLDDARGAESERLEAERKVEVLEAERDAALDRATSAESQLEKLKLAAGARALRKAGLEG